MKAFSIGSNTEVKSEFSNVYVAVFFDFLQITSN